jgi:hypothetical protein
MSGGILRKPESAPNGWGKESEKHGSDGSAKMQKAVMEKADSFSSNGFGQK